MRWMYDSAETREQDGRQMQMVKRESSPTTTVAPLGRTRTNRHMLWFPEVCQLRKFY